MSPRPPKERPPRNEGSGALPHPARKSVETDNRTQAACHEGGQAPVSARCALPVANVLPGHRRVEANPCTGVRNNRKNTVKKPWGRGRYLELGDSKRGKNPVKTGRKREFAEIATLPLVVFRFLRILTAPQSGTTRGTAGNIAGQNSVRPANQTFAGRACL